VHGRGSWLAWGLRNVQRERDVLGGLVGRAERMGGTRGVLSQPRVRAG
jgi:hypothetical protein